MLVMNLLVNVGDEFTCAVELDEAGMIKIEDVNLMITSDSFSDDSLDIVEYDSDFSWNEISHEDNTIEYETTNSPHYVSDENKDYVDLTFHVYNPVTFNVEFYINYQAIKQTNVSEELYESGYTSSLSISNTEEDYCGDGVCSESEMENPCGCFSDCSLYCS